MSFPIKKNLKQYLVIAILLVFTNVGWAKSFFANIDKIDKAYKDKKFSQVLTLINKSKSTKDINDLELYLKAESFKGLGRYEEAKNTFSKLLNKYPNKETAAKGRLPYFLCLLKTSSLKALPRLEAFAASLASSWQRGVAFEKLTELEGLKKRARSRLAIKSIREYHSDKAFYKKISASHSILKAIFEKPAEWMFNDKEWLELIDIAVSEGLGKIVLKHKGKLIRSLGVYGNDAFLIFEALILSDKNQKNRAISILNQLLSRKLSHPSLKPFAYQSRANILYFNKKYDLAVTDYKKVLANPVFPANSRMALYRLMRSKFKLGKNSECLTLLRRLARNKNAEPIFPSQIYEMALELYDAGKKVDSVPYFMFLVKNFPGHYRADDAIGYSVFALGKKSKEGKRLLRLLKAKYPNSFFLFWHDSKMQKAKLRGRKVRVKAYSSALKKQIKSWKLLLDTPFAYLAREEMRKRTNKKPLDLRVFKAAIDVATQANDGNLQTAFGERLARRLLESGKSLKDMPEWAWKAHYPKPFAKNVKKYSKKFGIDSHWVLSIMREESHFNPDTLSRSNAHGLMQILPSTGKWIAGKVGVRRFRRAMLWRPEINIKFGCWYLDYLAKLFNGNLYLASASYNGGQGNVLRKVEKGPFAKLPVLERLDKIPLSETRDYYKKVMGSYYNYNRLYRK